jgi:hypothetical protein
MQRHVQPRGSAQPSSEQVQGEIQNFLRAIDSYPDRFAKQPGVSFQRHLCSFFSQVPENGGRRTASRQPSRQKSSAA